MASKTLRARRLRMIGEPADRYREDPVRMLRAVRLTQARLAIGRSHARTDSSQAELIENVPPRACSMQC